MAYQDYIEMTCELNLLEPWREIYISELSDLGFESFEETPGGFKAYIEKDLFDREKVMSLIAENAKDASHVATLDFRIIVAENWNAVWESNFEPVVIGSKCLVRAPFHASAGEYPIEIVIEPKMSFGTGHHETTVLMAEWILRENMQHKAVLDMGCGTGLLAMIAAKMGANPVEAIDNDPAAYENAQENVIRNNCGGIKVLPGDGGSLGKNSYDLIIANITKNILLQDLPKYVAVLIPGGKLMMSGFFEYDKDELVLNAEKSGLELIDEKSKKGWLALCFKHRLPY